LQNSRREAAFWHSTAYTPTLNELKAIRKVNAQAGQSGAVTKTSLESMLHDDDFQEGRSLVIPRRQPRSRLYQSTKSAASKLPTEAVISLNFFALLRTNAMDTEIAGAENTLLKKEAPRKSGRPPPIVMTSTINLIRLQSDLNEHIQRRVQVPKYMILNS
jgi:hypothetical protein